MNITFDVTAEDIAKGVPGHSERCPIARALTREIGEGCFASVSNLGGTVYKTYMDGQIRRASKKWGVTGISTDFRKFINDFDNGLPVQPQTFTVIFGE